MLGRISHRAPFLLALFAMLLFGVLDMIRGVVAPSILHAFSLNYALLGLLFSLSSIGYLVGSFLSGLVLDRLGQKPVMTVGISVLFFGLVFIAFGKTYDVLGLGYFLAGIGNGLMEIAVNSVVPLVATEHQSRYFNLLHGFYGAGATFAPIAAAWVISTFSLWQLPYVLAGFLVVVLFVLVLITVYPAAKPMPTAPLTKADSSLPLTKLFVSPALYLLILAIMVYVVAEVGIANWLPTFLHTSRGFSTSLAATFLALFYLTFTVGRFTGSVIVHRIGSVRSIVVASVLAFFCTLSASFFQGKASLLFIVAGLFFGLIFPTISSMASEAFPTRTATVMSMLFTFAGLGSIAATWLIGVIATSFGLTVGFYVMDTCLLGTGGLILLFSLYVKRQSRWKDTGCDVHMPVL